MWELILTIVVLLFGGGGFGVIIVGEDDVSPRMLARCE
jgi:hypothetical protein